MNKSSLITNSLVLFSLFLLGSCGGILEPYGSVAIEQKKLIILSFSLIMIVVVPVMIMTIVFAWKFREKNKKAVYRPEWSDNVKLEVIWWTIPIIIISILSVVIWKTSHSLDPYKPLESDKTPVTIEVVSLNWKWLFIYPDHNIATVNFVQVPENTPINFVLASDAPMNSFWIPQIAGQIYTMAGMKTKLHVMVNKIGEYRGLSANYSGVGFEGMQFTLKATNEQDFKDWIKTVKTSKNTLTRSQYDNLSKDSINHKVEYYTGVPNGLFEEIVMKYMDHMSHGDHTVDNKDKMLSSKVN